MKRKWLFLLLWPCFLLATKGYLPIAPGEESIAPWFTGPLLTPSANVVSAGSCDIEPSLYGIAYPASYDNDWKPRSYPTYWTIGTQLSTVIGISSWFDFRFIPSLFWNYANGHAHWELGDMIVKLEFQLHHDRLPHRSWLPSIKLSLVETVPIGKYRNLNPRLQQTDLGGQGSWLTGLQLTFGKEIHCYAEHFLHTRVSFLCNMGVPIHLKGFNAYGGGVGTNGTYYRGVYGEADLGLEYSLTRNWAFALDVVGAWMGSSRFQGNNGMTLAGDQAFHSIKANIQYSLAPAIEYNWSNHLGLIAGCWFTVAGKNVPQFANGIIKLNYFK